MGKYLDATGLSYLWNKIKEYVAGQVSGLSSGGEEPVLLAEITTAYLKSVIEAGESVWLIPVPDGVTIHQYASDNTKRYQIKVGDYYVGADFRHGTFGIASAILCGGTAYDTVSLYLGYPWIVEVVISNISGSAINVIYKGDGGSSA